MTKGIPDSAWRSLFEINVQSTGVWGYSALRLRRAAELLLAQAEEADRRLADLLRSPEPEESPNEFVLERMAIKEEGLRLDTQLYGVGHFLAALAIENLTKAILIGRDNDEGTGRFPARLATHDLLELVDRCNLEVSAEEAGVLARLTVESLWRGRYPLPKRWRVLKQTRALAVRFPEAHRLFPGEVGKHAFHIIDRLAAILEEERSRSG